MEASLGFVQTGRPLNYGEVAGIEIGVAATKTFVAQLVAFYLLALDIAWHRQSLPESRLLEIIKDLRQLPAQMEQLLQSQEKYIEELASDFNETQDFIKVRHLIEERLKGQIQLAFKTPKVREMHG